MLFLLFTVALLIKARIEGVEVLLIQPIGRQTQALAEALVMHDLAFAQEFDRIAHIGIVNQTQDIVIGRSGLLLSRQIFVQIGDDVALALNICGRERYACRRRRIYACGMIDKVGVKSAFLDLLVAETARQLINDRTDHFQMSQFFRTQRSIENVPQAQNGGQAPYFGFPVHTFTTSDKVWL